MLARIDAAGIQISGEAEGMLLRDPFANGVVLTALPR